MDTVVLVEIMVDGESPCDEQFFQLVCRVENRKSNPFRCTQCFLCAAVDPVKT